MGGDTWIDYSSSALNGKSVSDLIGTYMGGGGGLTVFAGGSAYRFTNLRGVSMVMKSMHGFSFDIRLGPAFQPVKKMRKLPGFFDRNLFAISMLKTSTTGTPLETQTPILGRNSSGTLVLKLGENTIEDEVRCYKLKDPSDPTSVCGESTYTARTTLPSGTEARWNGKTFEVTYTIQGTDKQTKRRIANRNFKAIDGSIITSIKSGEKVEVYSEKNGNVILSRDDGAVVVSHKDEMIDFDQIKAFRFVWDGN
jgi:hypothetical protein